MKVRVGGGADAPPNMRAFDRGHVTGEWISNNRSASRVIRRMYPRRTPPILLRLFLGRFYNFCFVECTHVLFSRVFAFFRCPHQNTHTHTCSRASNGFPHRFNRLLRGLFLAPQEPLLGLILAPGAPLDDVREDPELREKVAKAT